MHPHLEDDEHDKDISSETAKAKYADDVAYDKARDADDFNQELKKQIERHKDELKRLDELLMAFEAEGLIEEERMIDPVPAHSERKIAQQEANQPEDVAKVIAHVYTARPNMESVDTGTELTLFTGVPLKIIEDLFHVFKENQNNLLAEMLAFKDNTVGGIDIQFPDREVAVRFVTFLKDIQNSRTPDIASHQKRCEDYFGLSLIVNAAMDCISKLTTFVEEINPIRQFKM